MSNRIIYAPQKGPQTLFHATPADIAVYGGAAGSGKTFSLLLEPLRHVNNGLFRSQFFRRTTVQLRLPGGPWQESLPLYKAFGGRPRESFLDWHFPSGSVYKFSHLEQEKNIFDYQGAQFPFVGFDELTHFSIRQFFYLISRLRSGSGISGYARGTCNPDPDHWLRQFLTWWIDPESGFPIKERSGVLRWFVRDNDRIMWSDTKGELEAKYGKDSMPKSVTFVSANIFDNKILMQKDPSYLSNLKAQCWVDRMQLLEGNWNIRATAGTLFKKHYFEVVDSIPWRDITTTVRAWDRAATEVNESTARGIDPDWTVGVKLAKSKHGIYYVLDVRRDRLTPGKVDDMILNTAKQDGVNCKIRLFQDPGSAGVHEMESMVKLLSGFNVTFDKINKSKVVQAKPASVQSEFGFVKILRGPWNDLFLSELEAFPEGKKDDQVDGFSGALNCINSENVGDFTDSFEHDDNITSFDIKGGSIW